MHSTQQGKYSAYLTPEHAKIYDAFIRFLKKNAQTADFSRTEHILKIGICPTGKQDGAYLKTINQLSEKNFCRFLFSVFAKVKGKSLTDKNSLKEIGVFLGGISLCFFVSVLIAGFVPSLLFFIALSAICYIICSPLGKAMSKLFSYEKHPHSSEVQKALDECISDSLWRESCSRIGNVISNSIPGKEILAKAPGQVGKFFSNDKKESQPNSEEHLVVKTVATIVMAVATSMLTFVIMSALGLGGGTLTVLMMIGTLVFTTVKAGYGLFFYDDRKDVQESRSEWETEFNKWAANTGLQQPSGQVSESQYLQPCRLNGY